MAERPSPPGDRGERVEQLCIGTEAGILQSVRSRFMNGQNMFSMEHLDDLAYMLDLNITLDEATKAPKGSTRGQYQ
jgi:hypothetical protein